IVI
ncbi:hypothetical protein JL09_g6986, partial [Pichia kudriavzevii]